MHNPLSTTLTPYRILLIDRLQVSFDIVFPYEAVQERLYLHLLLFVYNGCLVCDSMNLLYGNKPVSYKELIWVYLVRKVEGTTCCKSYGESNDYCIMILLRHFEMLPAA